MNNLNFNPWHKEEMGKEAPDIVKAVIEIEQGTKGKYELDKTSGLLRLDRVLFSTLHYPSNYFFIPRTLRHTRHHPATYGFTPRPLADDHAPLDILVLSQIAIHPLCLVRARVLGAMRMLDNNEGDDKIIAVAADDISMAHYKHITELPDYFQMELKQFFEDYKKLEKKAVAVEEFQDEKVAFEIINRAIESYKEEFAERG